LKSWKVYNKDASICLTQKSSRAVPSLKTFEQ
jgi:hypothetical protein